MPPFRKFRISGSTAREQFDGRHRFEHWYCDNQVYFITARCRDRYPAFRSEEAKAIFWDRFDYYSKLHGSVAKLVNDLLPERRVPFWRDDSGKDYFDGCIRDELQCRRAYRYTYT
jgi:hypothetical protein